MTRYNSWILFLLVLLSCPTAQAADRPIAKLQRGVVNVITAPVEIPKQARIYWKKGAEKTDHILVWILSGIVKGMQNTVCRTASGVWDIVSFPSVRPADFQPLFKPDYVFQEWPTRDSKTCPCQRKR